MSCEVVVHPKAVKRLNRLPDDTRELMKARLRDLSKEFGRPQMPLRALVHAVPSATHLRLV